MITGSRTVGSSGNNNRRSSVIDRVEHGGCRAKYGSARGRENSSAANAIREDKRARRSCSDERTLAQSASVGGCGVSAASELDNRDTISAGRRGGFSSGSRASAA